MCKWTKLHWAIQAWSIQGPLENSKGERIGFVQLFLMTTVLLYLLSFLVLPPVLVPRQSEYPRGPLPYHMQHANHHGMPKNANFLSYSQCSPGAPGG